MVDRLVPVDDATKQFPTAVRDVIASNLANPGTPEGAVIADIAATDAAVADKIENGSATVAALDSNYARILTPEAFGATGDGSTDDSTALAAMFAALQSGDQIQGKAGATYRHVSALTISGVDGWSWAGGTYTFAGTATSVSGAISGLTITGCDSFRIEGIRVESSNQAQEYNGISLNTSTKGTLRGVTAYNFRWVGLAVNGTGCTDITLDGCFGLRCHVGAYSDSPGTRIRGGRYSSEWTQTAEYITKAGVWSAPSLYYDGIIIKGTDWLVDGVTLDDNGQSGIYSSGGGGTERGVVQGCHITGNWNKGIDFGVVGAKSGSNYIENVLVANNVVMNNKTGNIHFASVDDSVITGNVSIMDATATNCVQLNLISLRNTVIGNTVVSGSASAAVFVDNPAGSINNKVLMNAVTASTPYTVNSSNNALVSLGDTSLSIVSKLLSELIIDLSAGSAASGREALEIVGSADNTYVQITTNSKELRVANSGGTTQNIRGGAVTADTGLTVGSGTAFFGDAALLRLPRTSTTNAGNIWYDAAAGTLKYRDGVAGVTRTVTAT